MCGECGLPHQTKRNLLRNCILFETRYFAPSPISTIHSSAPLFRFSLHHQEEQHTCRSVIDVFRQRWSTNGYTYPYRLFLPRSPLHLPSFPSLPPSLPPSSSLSLSRLPIQFLFFSPHAIILFDHWQVI